MDDEIEIISDANGIAVISDARLVDEFLVSNGLNGADMHLGRRSTHLHAAGRVADAAAKAQQRSSRWMQLTEESAKAVKTAQMVRNSSTGNLHAILSATNGKFSKNLQFVAPTAAKAATGPAGLAVLGATMLKMSAEQSMKQIEDYLEVIDAKVDDVLRAQKDAVLGDMIGIDLVIEEAMSVRAEVGHVSEVTWSKVQATAVTVARTQAYALRQLDALAGKVESAGIRETASVVASVESEVQDWLTVLAQCSRLQDGLIVLELDHVMATAPDHVADHRRGLEVARRARLAAIHRSTETLLERMNGIGNRANTKVLLAPRAARTALQSSAKVTDEVLALQTALGIEDGHESPSARLWPTAAAEAKSKVVGAGVDGVHAARDKGGEAADRLRSGAGRLAHGARAFRDAVKQGESQS
ncbi:hypothetical protein [Brachybacterium nesterenkovii]|uniref:hypothetical protein n=1 Tax=Brachybacterium nesterenkovii TaxID=47847 RepID=UPI00321B846D